MRKRIDLGFFTPAQRPADEAARQALVSSFRYADAAQDADLAAIVDRAAELLGAPQAALSIIDADRQNWIVRRGLAGEGTARAISFCGHVVADPAGVMVVEDASRDHRFTGNPLVNGRLAALRFYAGAPLLHEGTPLGALCAVDEAAHGALDAEQKAELTRLAECAVEILATRYR